MHRLASRVRVHRDGGRARASRVLIENDRHHPLFAVSSEDGDAPSGLHAPGDEAVFSVTFENVFAPGRIHVTPWIVHAGGAPIIDRRPRLAAAVVTGRRTARAASSTCPATCATTRGVAGAGMSVELGPADPPARRRSAAARGASSTSR